MKKLNKITLKKGDTLTLLMALKDAADGTTPLDLSIDQIKSKIKTASGELFDEFVVSKSDTAGEYILKAKKNTTEYPIGTLNSDIRFEENGEVVHSETFEIEITKSETE